MGEPAAGRPFTPGQSGNPGGRPRTKGLAAELRRRYGEDGRELLDHLDQLLSRRTTPPSVQLRAIELIFAYSFGRPADVLGLVPYSYALDLLKSCMGAVRQQVRDPVVLGAIQRDFAAATHGRIDFDGSEKTGDGSA